MKSIFIVLIAGSFFLSGCALLNKIAPPQVDEVGKPLPGTHELSPIVKTATDAAGPYSQAAAAVFLLVWNFTERFKSKKSGTGLVATLTGLKSAAKDPATKAAFEQIKLYLKNAHNAAGIRKDINALLAKL